MPGAGTPDFADIRTKVAAVEGLIASFGTKLDAQKLLDLALKAAPHHRAFHRWPSTPVLSDTMDALDAIGRWKAQTPQQLTSGLAADLRRIAKLIATPRE